MPKTLAILEVSQKQAYIFSSKFLKENRRRSRAIRVATEELWMECLSESLTREERQRRLVYAGGGHIILQFESRKEAEETIRAITYRAYTDFAGMEMFAKLWDYDSDLPQREERYQGLTAPAANLKELTRQLEIKKSLRAASFRRRSTGLEELDEVTFQPREPGRVLKLDPEPHPLIPEENLEYAHEQEFDGLAGKDNFIAVVHIDGNNMGAKSQRVTEEAGDDWKECCKKHQLFSESVERAFQTALWRTYKMVEEKQQAGELEELGITDCNITHPMKPVVAAGDDICFVTSGKLGIECAAYFLRALQNPNDPRYPIGPDNHGAPWEAELEPYSACAGVAMVHTKYPFHRAYELSEDLCSSAKRYAAELGQDKTEAERECISTIDWHIEFGQGRGSVSESREDYLTEDSGDGKTKENPIRSLTLRPLVVIGDGEKSFRSYQFFLRLFDKLSNSLTEDDSERTRDKVARSKLKGLREPLKQGEWETKLYIRENGLNELEKWAYDQIEGLHAGKRTQESFTPVEQEGQGEKRRYTQRSLSFDAIELVDHLMILDREELK